MSNSHRTLDRSSLRFGTQPEESILVLRSYQRQRTTLIEDQRRFVPRMQKALEQMNVKLTQAVSDVLGVTGLAIIEAIVAGQRDPHKLAELRRHGCKRDQAAIALALVGTGWNRRRSPRNRPENWSAAVRKAGDEATGISCSG